MAISREHALEIITNWCDYLDGDLRAGGDITLCGYLEAMSKCLQDALGKNARLCSRGDVLQEVGKLGAIAVCCFETHGKRY